MNKREAIDRSISHWERMIEWASQQDGESPVIRYEMIKSLDESWYSENCELCNCCESENCELCNFCEKEYIFYYSDIDSCRVCPLARKHGDCSCTLTGIENSNHWTATNQSETWEEWVDNAKIFLNQLRGLGDDNE